MVRKAEELCAKHGWFLCHQFENEARERARPGAPRARERARAAQAVAPRPQQS